jgi:hypothetical protein
MKPRQILLGTISVSYAELYDSNWNKLMNDRIAKMNNSAKIKWCIKNGVKVTYHKIRDNVTLSVSLVAYGTMTDDQYFDFLLWN